MRNAFADSLVKLFSKDKKRILLAGDIGNRLFDKLKLKKPNSFINCGIAEANMTGVAAGLALSGFRPITYTITPFNTLRCIEQIKVDICYQNLPVTIVGTGSGLSYSSFGITHQSLDDLAIMKTLPNLTILCPSTPNEVKFIISNLNLLKGPTYIRLGKKGEKEFFPKLTKKYSFLKIQKLVKGNDICIINVGHILELSNDLVNLVNNSSKKYTASLYNLVKIKPLDTKELIKIIKKYKITIITEEHGIQGSVYESIVAMTFKNFSHKKIIHGVNIPDKVHSYLGSQKEARLRLGLNAREIAKKYNLL